MLAFYQDKTHNATFTRAHIAEILLNSKVWLAAIGKDNLRETNAYNEVD